MSPKPTAMVGKQSKNKPKPRARRTKSEVQSSHGFTAPDDDTDPSRADDSNNNTPANVGAELSSPDNLHHEPIRPRSSSRRRAYIIKRPQSAPFFGRVKPRAFTPDEPGDAVHSQPTHDSRSPTGLSPVNRSSQDPVNTGDYMQACRVTKPSLPERNVPNFKDNEIDGAVPSPLQHGKLSGFSRPSVDSPIVSYEEMHTFLHCENGIDRKEHVVVSVSETIVIDFPKSDMKGDSEIVTGSEDLSQTISSFISSKEICDPTGKHTDVPVSQLYAQVVKPKPSVVENSLTLDHGDYDDFIQSASGVSTARGDPVLKGKSLNQELNVKGSNDLEVTSCDPKLKQFILSEPSSNLTAISKSAEGMEQESEDQDDTDPRAESPQSPSHEIFPQNDLSEGAEEQSTFIPPLRLDGIVGDDTFTPEASPVSGGNSDSPDNDSPIDIHYSNIDTDQVDAQVSVAKSAARNEESMCESSSPRHDGPSKVDTTPPTGHIVPNPNAESLPVSESAEQTGNQKLNEAIANLKASQYTLPDKPNICGLPDNTNLRQRQQTVLAGDTSHPIKSSPDHYRPVKKLSVEYTDPVELHSSDILQAGGTLHDPQEPLSSALSEDTDSEEAHKVKKRQNNPLKRLFARKKGKYNPSLDIDAAKSTLPSLEPDKPRAKKEKSSSPKLFKRKNKAKIFLSESELSPSDETSTKQRKDKKKKFKPGKLTKESIVVIKSSGKSLSDSMPDLAVSAIPACNEPSKADECSGERTRAKTSNGNNALTYERDHSSADIQNFYANMTPKEATEEAVTTSPSDTNNKEGEKTAKPSVNVETGQSQTSFASTDGSREVIKVGNNNQKGVISPDANTVRPDTMNDSPGVNIVRTDMIDEWHAVNTANSDVNFDNPDMNIDISTKNEDDSDINNDMSHLKSDDLDIEKFCDYRRNDDENEDENMDAYCNTEVSPSFIDTQDINIDIEPTYDSPYREEQEEADGIVVNSIDMSFSNKNHENSSEVPTFCGPLESESSLVSSRMNKYLYKEDRGSNEMESNPIRELSQADQNKLEIKNQKKLEGVRISAKNGHASEDDDNNNNNCEKPKRILASIETTESDDEVDEKLLGALATDNPLRRPKYAKTRLEAKLTGTPIPNDPPLQESRYADKHPSDEEYQPPQVLNFKPKIPKKKEHRDRIERGEVSLEDASVLDTSGAGLSPRSDASSDVGIDSENACSFHDVIGLCDSLEPQNDDDEEEEEKDEEAGAASKYSKAKSLNRTPSQLLIRADVHAASENSDNNKSFRTSAADLEANLRPGVEALIGGEKLSVNCVTSADLGGREIPTQTREFSSSVEVTGESRTSYNKLEISSNSCTNASDSTKETLSKMSTLNTENGTTDLPTEFNRIKDIEDQIREGFNSPCLSLKQGDVKPVTQCFHDPGKKETLESCDPIEGGKVGHEEEIGAEVTKVTSGDKEHNSYNLSSVCNERESEKQSVTPRNEQAVNLNNISENPKFRKEQKNLRSKNSELQRKVENKPVLFQPEHEEKLKEYEEDVIIPSVRKSVESKIFTYTESLQKLDEGSYEPQNRPPPIKQKPPSWKMKTFLRKFDKVASPTTPNPLSKPQRQRCGVKESINKDLLQDAMKELDDFIDNEFDDQSDEEQGDKISSVFAASGIVAPPVASKPANVSKTSLVELTMAEQNQVPVEDPIKAEVNEELICKTEAAKEKSSHFESLFDRLFAMPDKGDNQASFRDSAGNGETDSGDKTTEQYPSVSKTDNSELEQDSTANIELEITRTESDRGNGRSVHVNSLISEENLGSGFLPKAYNIVDAMDQKNGTLSKKGREIDQSIAHPLCVAQEENVTAAEATKEEIFALFSTPDALDISGSQFFETDPSSAKKIEDFNRNQQPAFHPEPAQTVFDLSSPPPIPVKKAKDDKRGVPTIPALPEPDKEAKVVDLGYEDVADKLSDSEKSSDEKPCLVKQESVPKQSPSAGNKRFHFPWKKKSKDAFTKRDVPAEHGHNTKSGCDEKHHGEVNADTHAKKTSPISKKSAKEEIPKVKGGASQKKSPREKKPKEKKKKPKDKQHGSAKDPKVKEKNEKGKKKVKPKSGESCVEVYHEIEERASVRGDVESKQTKQASVRKKEPTSSSTSASSSPLSSSPLSADSSDESDYEPVNYVESKIIEEKGESKEIKERITSADSNGYEIPTENPTAENRSHPHVNKTAGPALSDMNPSVGQESSHKGQSTAPNSREKQALTPKSKNLIKPKLPEKSWRKSQSGSESGDEIIEPYLTFKYPKYLDDGEIYVGSPVAVKHMQAAGRGSDNARSKLGDRNGALEGNERYAGEQKQSSEAEESLKTENCKSGVEKIPEDKSFKERMSVSTTENLGPGVFDSNKKEQKVYINDMCAIPSESGTNESLINVPEECTEAANIEQKICSPHALASPGAASSPELAVKSHISEALPHALASPGAASSPELAVKSHISEALSKAFQDFDFGFEGSGPTSDAENCRTSPKVDRDKVSSIQWEWRDPPAKEPGNHTESPGVTREIGDTKTNSSEDKLGLPCSGGKISEHEQMFVAGVGASVILDEIGSSFAAGAESNEWDNFESVSNLTEGHLARSDNREHKFVTSDSSSNTDSPPSSPVSDMHQKERSRLGKALAKRQAKRRAKSKEKIDKKDGKRAKSKDKVKRKESKERDKSRDKKKDKNRNDQNETLTKSKEKHKKKEPDDKDKWKWPWQRRGSKKEASLPGNQSANESEKESEPSRDNVRSKAKKRKKKPVSSTSKANESSTDQRQAGDDLEDIALEDETSDCLLESALSSNLDDHDYFNTFLESSQCFQLSESIVSKISTKEAEADGIASKDEVTEVFKTLEDDFVSKENINLTMAASKDINCTSALKEENKQNDDEEITDISSETLKEGLETYLKHDGPDDNKNMAKDAPWKVFQIPDLQSSCSLSSGDPWKDYSPLEIGKTQTPLESQRQALQSESETKDEPQYSSASPGQSEGASPSEETGTLTKEANDANRDSFQSEKLDSEFSELSSLETETPEEKIGASENRIDWKIEHSIKQTVSKPTIACRTVSQPNQTRTPPVPRVRKTLRRHRSELDTPDKDVLVEFNEIWNTSAANSTELRDNKTENPSLSAFSMDSISSFIGQDLDANTERMTLPPDVEDEDENPAPYADATSSALELKPKTRRMSAGLMNDIENCEVLLSKKIPAKPERQKQNMERSEPGEDTASMDVKNVSRQTKQDGEEEFGVEYDKLPVRVRKFDYKPTIKPFVPPVPINRPANPAAPSYTPVERSPAQRHKSVEKTEYAAPWEETIKALTPTLPPRKYRRSSSDTPVIDSARGSRRSLTSIDLGAEGSDNEPQSNWSLRKSVSLDFGLDNEPTNQKICATESKDNSTEAGGSKARKPLFRSFISLFHRSRKSNRETNTINDSKAHPDDDRESNVFEEERDEQTLTNFNLAQHSDKMEKENENSDKRGRGKAEPEKPKKSEKLHKPEKPPKPEKFFKTMKTPKKQPQPETPKRRISAPLLDGSSADGAQQGLEGRPLCRLLKVNEDETRVVEMIRPQTGPLGVFFTKGQEHQEEGLLVNAFQDPNSSKLFAGILCIGDEILEIDGCDIRHLTLEQVGEVMQDKERMIVRIMPAEVARSTL
ncbi:hypothetical protein PoB_000410700 [Plakobranchus ocellatus]|uniref:PDZ domain-containing protein n=1 Tax=Plakobranchus ocellatus TaxID=259542 RepID=A0AAV3Y643_9GAST|nr:hypothetical protein PoB_000410700 [Plakobranchus ocellatus]